MPNLEDDKADILLIEDDPDIILILQTVLERAGYRVHSANSGESAFMLMENITPDLILCDIMLPHMDGYEIRKILQRDIRLQLIPFIYLTALSDIKDKMKAFELNPDDYITKPFDPQELLARINAKLKRFKLYDSLIKIDGLTGLLNRRALMTELTHELERSRRYNRSMSLLMIDIDNFKALNDRFGHLFGDNALKSLAEVMEQNFREIDFIGRYGGEEFIIGMPEIGKSECLSAAKRLQALLKNISLEDQEFDLTISGGVATAPEDGLDAKELIMAADKALYMAKSKGKDCILPYQAG